MTAKLIPVLMRGLLVWLVLISAESMHGTLRELFLKPLVGDLRARQISFFTALVIIFTITFLLIRWVRASSNKQLFAIGIMWVVLTFSFEALAALLLSDVSLERFLADYNIFQGGLMAIGLIILGVAPILTSKIRE